MSNAQLIAVDVFATHQGVDVTFVLALHERGLIHITVLEAQPFLEPTDLARVEQLARMYYDLDINLEGIEAICHLMDRMETAQHEAHILRERLRLYE